MNILKHNKILFLLFHALLGLVVHFVGSFVFIYFALFLVYGTYWIINTSDKNYQVLILILYTLGLEVLFRMRSDGALYDIGKYSVIYFCILGFSFNRINLNAWPYFVILLLFIPGIILTVNTFFFEIDVRKKIMFNLLGPFSLIAASLYTYNKSITLNKLNDFLFIAAGPLVSILTLVFIFTPTDSQAVFKSASSNFSTSGGFGPNQMSVILGLGVFVFFIQFFFNLKDKLFAGVCLLLLFAFAYRGIITFSRGGALTAILMIIVFCIVVFRLLNGQSKSKFLIFVSILPFVFVSAWFYSSFVTGGMIDKRYNNQDAAGRVKESKMSGREDIMETDLKFFYENPVFGVGPGIGGMMRGDEGLKGVQAHSEPTRLLAEHGSMGLIILLLLVFVPIIKYFRFRLFHHIYFFPFLIFWGLTINHAATRIVAPGVLYALTLLNVSIKNKDDEDSVPRQ